MVLEGKHIFITGGGGFIGTSLVAELIDNNWITIYDNERRSAIRYTGLRSHPNLSCIHGDVLDREHLEQSLGNADIVIHLAAITGASSYDQCPVETLETNITGTANILRACAGKRIEKLIHFSSSEVYGSRAENVPEDGPTVIEALTDLRWTYAVSKIASDAFVMSYTHTTGLPTVLLRPFNIYGPLQVGEGAVHAIVAKALRGESVTVYGDGSQTRAWCYIDDLVNATIAAIESRCQGEILNIGNPDEYCTIRELTDLILEMTGSESVIEYHDHPFQDIDIRRPDIGKARQLLGFEPAVSLKQGLKPTIEWYRNVYLPGEN